jgi:hypothetical protein
MEQVEVDPAGAAVLRNSDVANILQRLKFFEEQHHHLVSENKKHQKTIADDVCNHAHPDLEKSSDCKLDENQNYCH